MDSQEKNVLNISYTKDAGELAKYYSAADVLLYPSIADNCPLVVLEAQACGLPVVAFKTGGIPELVTHQITGYIAEYQNAKDLRRGLEYILSLERQPVETMHHKAIQKINNGFTVEKMADQYLQLYNQILKT